MAEKKQKVTKEEKAAARSAELMVIVHEQIKLVDRPQFGGMKPGAKVETGKLYFVSPDHLAVSNDRWDGDNGRLISDAEKMVESIVRYNGVIEPLLAHIKGPNAGECTLGDIMSGKVVPMVLKGNRRWEGAQIVAANASTAELVEGRLPVQFVFNLTAEEEAALRHDHGDRQGLTLPEVFKQIRHLVKTTTLTQAQIGVRMYSGFYAVAAAASRAKMDELDLKFSRKEITEEAMWAARKAWMRGQLQFGYALAQLPIEVTKYVAYQLLPKLASQDGVTVNWKHIVKDDAFELVKIKTETEAQLLSLEKSGDLHKVLELEDGAPTLAAKRDYTNSKVMKRLEDMVKPIVPAGGGGEDGDGGSGSDEGDRAKSMSRDELLQLAKRQESVILATVYEGIAGNAECRRQLPEIDALLYKFEIARKAQPDLIRRVLADADEVASALK